MAALKKGQVYRIVKATEEAESLSFGPGDTDFYGLVEGQTFKIDMIDDNGDGWSYTAGLPKGIIPFWLEHERLCMLCKGENNPDVVELVE